MSTWPDIVWVNVDAGPPVANRLHLHAEFADEGKDREVGR